MGVGVDDGVDTIYLSHLLPQSLQLGNKKDEKKRELLRLQIKKLG